MLAEFGQDFDILGVITELIGWLHLDNIDVVHLNRGGSVIRERPPARSGSTRANALRYYPDYIRQVAGWLRDQAD